MLILHLDEIYIFTGDETLYGLDAFRYDLTPSTYDRTKPSYDDCFKGVPTLPNGLSDASACYFGEKQEIFPHTLF